MSRLSIHLLFALIFAATTSSVDALVGSSPFGSNVSTRNAACASTSLHMVVGPKQALALEKRMNGKKFEATINNLMKSKKLTRVQAEKRYGEYLINPEGFALRAAEDERKKKGYKDWKEQAIARSDNPEATRERIDEYQKKNSLKGTAIILVFFTAVAYYNTVNPYVPPVN